MTEITTYIEQIADDMSLSFYHGADDKFNSWADENETWPCLFLDIYEAWNLVVSAQSTVQDNSTFNIYILNEYPLGALDPAINTIEQALKPKVREFINKCLQKETATGVKVFQVVEPGTAEKVIAKTDRNLCGWRVPITLEPSEKYINC